MMIHFVRNVLVGEAAGQGLDVPLTRVGQRSRPLPGAPPGPVG